MLSPFHGGNTGSIPVGRAKQNQWLSLVFAPMDARHALLGDKTRDSGRVSSRRRPAAKTRPPWAKEAHFHQALWLDDNLAIDLPIIQQPHGLGGPFDGEAFGMERRLELAVADEIQKRQHIFSRPAI